MNSFGASIATVIGLFIGLAVVSVIVSNHAQTSQVITSFGNALSSVIGAATKPVS